MQFYDDMSNVNSNDMMDLTETDGYDLLPEIIYIGNRKLDRAFNNIEKNKKSNPRKIRSIPISYEGANCLLCDGNMRVRNNSFENALFLGCSNYPDCKFSANMDKRDEIRFKRVEASQAGEEIKPGVFKF